MPEPTLFPSPISQHLRATLAASEPWDRAQADLRTVLEHMSDGSEAAGMVLHRPPGETFSRALLALVALSLVEELVRAQPPLARVEREAIADAASDLGHELMIPQLKGL